MGFHSEAALPLMRIPIIHEEPGLLVVDKPAHLPVHPSKPGGPFTLWDALRGVLAFEIANGGQVSIINRLDRETSGLTLVATTGASARVWHTAMEARGIDKEYVAVVFGWPERDGWSVDAPILRQGEVGESAIWLKQCVHAEGARAVSHFEVVRRFSRAEGRFAVLRVRTETGRMHQIRVHAAHSGHALVGDKIYGADEGCYLEFIETGWTVGLAGRLLLDRHALHASRLKTATQEWTVPLPADLRDFCQGG